MRKFGISSWCYPWSMGVTKGPQPKRKMTPLELLEKAADYGVQVVQIADNCPLDILSTQKLDALKQFADTKQISLEVGTKVIDPNHLLAYLNIAARLESPILRVLPSFFGSRAIMDEVEQNIRTVLDDFDKAGITMVLENTEAFKVEDYAGLMQRINHPRLGMCLDLANAIGALEGPEFVMKKLGPFTENFHFKDIRIKRSETVMGFTVEGVPAGEGDLSLPWILSELDTFGKQVSIIIELWPPFTETIEKTQKLEDQWVKESVKYLDSLMT